MDGVQALLHLNTYLAVYAQPTFITQQYTLQQSGDTVVIQVRRALGWPPDVRRLMNFTYMHLSLSLSLSTPSTYPSPPSHLSLSTLPLIPLHPFHLSLSTPPTYPSPPLPLIPLNPCPIHHSFPSLPLHFLPHLDPLGCWFPVHQRPGVCYPIPLPRWLYWCCP